MLEVQLWLLLRLKCPKIKITVVDKNSEKIKFWNGDLDKLPVFEPGLKEIIKEVRNKNLFFSTNIDTAIDLSEMIFMAVNTPTKDSGEGIGMAADLKYVEACAKDIARVAKTDKIVVEKSTLPVRTAEKIKDILKKESKGVDFEILSNPEFLAEGTAIQDLFKSDRVLIGGDNSKSGQKAVQLLVDIYSNWIPKDKILTTNVWSAELSKLASNAMLAQRISSINSLSALCEKTGANIDEVSQAIGMDHRIGNKFLKASPGFGGSCFQKDILNLVYLCKYYNLDEVADYWIQVIKINNYQKERFSNKIIEYFRTSTINNEITLLGWSFKKNTNDSRESASIYICDYLLSSEIKINIYDPLISKIKIITDLRELWKSKNNSASEINNKIKKLNFFTNTDDAIKDSEVIAILTEWDEFKKLNWKNITRTSKVFDGRNITNHYHYSIGK